jgi:LCP family protein required for cell wall assembly
MKSRSLLVFVFLGLCLLVFIGWVGAYAYQQRLGPALESTPMDVFYTSVPQALPSLTPIPTATPEPPTETPAPPTPIPPTVQAGVCGETTAWNILILGSDAGAPKGLKGSDLTRLLRADFPNRRVVVYALPRELWVETADLGLVNPTVNATRLGQVFHEGRLRSLQFAKLDTLVDGTRATARMLSSNFQLSTDHYLTVDLQNFPALVDAIGGIPIYIPERTTDPWIGMVIQPGQQTLNGTQAAAYARAIPDSDFGRIRRNQLLMEALRQRLLDPQVWEKIPQLYTQFKQVVATDLSLEQVNHLACLLREVPTSAVIQDGVRQEWTSPGPQGSLSWNRANVLNQLRGLGLIP